MPPSDRLGGRIPQRESLVGKSLALHAKIGTHSPGQAKHSKYMYLYIYIVNEQEGIHN